jgi:hypothetical protein
MSLILQAPVPGINTTTVLPSPGLADVKKRQHELVIFRSINGTKKTSVKSNPRRQLNFDFTLDRMKAEELKRFIQAFFASKIRLTDSEGDVWEGYLTANPFEFAQPSRSGLTIQIQFEGTQVS